MLVKNDSILSKLPLEIWPIIFSYSSIDKGFITISKEWYKLLKYYVSKLKLVPENINTLNIPNIVALYSNITELDLSNKKYINFSGRDSISSTILLNLTTFTKLQILNLKRAIIKIEDIHNLSILTILTELNLCNIEYAPTAEAAEDLGPLNMQYFTNLVNLKYLNLKNTWDITNIKCISHFTNLTYFNTNSIDKQNFNLFFNNLTSLHNITKLILSNILAPSDKTHNEIEAAMRSISFLTNLNTLKIKDSQMPFLKLNFLLSLTKLTYLDIKESYFDEGYWKNISKIETLRTLHLWAPTELTYTSALTQLKELSFSVHQYSISIPVFTKLEKLAIFVIPSSLDLSPISTLTNLKHITLSGKINETIRNISSLTKLIYVSLVNSSTVNNETMQYLTSLTNITYLDLKYTQVDDEGIKLFKKLPNLTIKSDPKPPSFLFLIDK